MSGIDEMPESARFKQSFFRNNDSIIVDFTSVEDVVCDDDIYMDWEDFIIEEDIYFRDDEIYFPSIKKRVLDYNEWDR